MQKGGGESSTAAYATAATNRTRARANQAIGSPGLERKPPQYEKEDRRPEAPSTPYHGLTYVESGFSRTSSEQVGQRFTDRADPDQLPPPKCPPTGWIDVG